jgi:predicted nucleic acid-binding protein
VAAVVIADASPLIALARVNGLGWLQELFGEVLVADVVVNEGLTGSFPESEKAIRSAMERGWLRQVEVSLGEPVLPDLDEGEAASIRLALSAGSKPLLLIDERAGRAIAQEMGLRVAGTAAVIGMARLKGLIPPGQGEPQAEGCRERSPDSRRAAGRTKRVRPPFAAAAAALRPA